MKRYKINMNDRKNLIKERKNKIEKKRKTN